MSLVIAENLSKTYRTGEVEVEALKGVNLNIDAASFVSIIGPSGSGKSTLLNIVGCLDLPDDGGKIEVAGVDITKLSRFERAKFRGLKLGFVFQDFNLLPVLTVYENVEYPLLMVQKLPSKERRQRVVRLLDAVGILDLEKKYPQQISGGQKQRVAVARALITNCDLVLADEPTANLDTKTAQMIISLMKKMRDEFKTTFVFSTHDPRIVNEAEIIYSLEDGFITSYENKKGDIS